MKNWPVNTNCHTGTEDTVGLLKLSPEAIIK